MLPLELRLPTLADSRWKTELSAEEVLFCLITTTCCWSLLFSLLMTSQCVAVCLPVGLAELGPPEADRLPRGVTLDVEPGLAGEALATLLASACLPC